VGVAGIIPEGQVAVGFQLPIQSLSSTFARPWEHEAGPAELASIAAAADAAGFFYVAVCDHVATPVGSPIGASWYDTVATLSWLAAQTERVHLLSHVYVVPYRHPLVVAKAFSTLDLLSSGRAILGVGAGHLREEFDALGVDYDRRGALLDEGLAAAAAAMAEGASSAQSPDFAYREMQTGPRAARPGGPPIWVGGSSRRAIERAALYDGWLPQGPPKDGTRAAIDRIRSLRDAAGLGGLAFDMGVNCEPVYVGTPPGDVPEWTASGDPEAIAQRLGRYLRLGINQLQLQFPVGSAGELVDQIGRFGRDVLPTINEMAR
jgi:probable F420-dependent oxidoreductase